MVKKNTGNWYVDRRIGGLENQFQDGEKAFCVDRRIGGLEMFFFIV